jgi:hypothetical protein
MRDTGREDREEGFKVEERRRRERRERRQGGGREEYFSCSLESGLYLFPCPCVPPLYQGRPDTEGEL